MSTPPLGLIVLTDRAQAAGDLAGVVDDAVAGGARTLLLREKDLPPTQRRHLALDLVDVLHPVGGDLIVASDVEVARQTGASGVHLAASDPWPRDAGGMLVGRSCHTLAELLDAQRNCADYATVSPVFSTTSKPGYGPPLGLDGLAELCRAARDLPVVALGGIGPGRVEECLAAGAAGVAVMGAVMEANDPAAAVTRLVDEVEMAQDALRG